MPRPGPTSTPKGTGKGHLSLSSSSRLQGKVPSACRILGFPSSPIDRPAVVVTARSPWRPPATGTPRASGGGGPHSLKPRPDQTSGREAGQGVPVTPRSHQRQGLVSMRRTCSIGGGSLPPGERAGGRQHRRPHIAVTQAPGPAALTHALEYFIISGIQSKAHKTARRTEPRIQSMSRGRRKQQPQVNKKW